MASHDSAEAVKIKEAHDALGLVIKTKKGFTGGRGGGGGEDVSAEVGLLPPPCQADA